MQPCINLPNRLICFECSTFFAMRLFLAVYTMAFKGYGNGKVGVGKHTGVKGDANVNEIEPSCKHQHQVSLRWSAFFIELST